MPKNVEAYLDSTLIEKSPNTKFEKGALLDQAHFILIYYSWRPTSPDPCDDHVIDCAMNAGARIITANTRDFQSARDSLGLHVLTPIEAISYLDTGENQ